MRRMTTLAVATLSASLALAGCSLGGGSSEPTGAARPTSAGSGSADAAPENKDVVLVTHDSFSVDKQLLAAFTQETGYVVKVQPSGDAGQLANKLVLTKDSPVGDAVFGIDNTFASRVVSAGVLDRYSPPAQPAGAATYALPDAAGKAELTPVDNASTCVNIDTTWFAKQHLAPPTSFADLVKPQYKNLFVTSGPPTSSPGLGLLLATIGTYGQNGWQAYWKQLMANGTKITSGWEDAYNVDFTQGEGHGSRPIVWSYDSSPAFTVKDGKSSTKALLDTCFRQVEYAGVLKGAKNPAGAKALVQWMQGKAFQAALPDSMYVFPVRKDVALPPEWAKFAKPATAPIAVSPAQITQHREAWLTQWQDIAGK